MIKMNKKKEDYLKIDLNDKISKKDDLFDDRRYDKEREFVILRKS